MDRKIEKAIEWGWSFSCTLNLKSVNRTEKRNSLVDIRTCTTERSPKCQCQKIIIFDFKPFRGYGGWWRWVIFRISDIPFAEKYLWNKVISCDRTKIISQKRKHYFIRMRQENKLNFLNSAQIYVIQILCSERFTSKWKEK